MPIAKIRENFFTDTFGDIKDNSYKDIQQKLIDANLEDPTKLNINGRKYHIGEFSTPTLVEARNDLESFSLIFRESVGDYIGGISGGNEVGDIWTMHANSGGGVIQAASQFNTLEFVYPSQIPEHGIACYVYDRTQGPACAESCATGTAYRNWLVRVENGVVSNNSLVQGGQTADNQINCLVDVHRLIKDKAISLGIASPDRHTHQDSIYFAQEIPAGDFFAFKNGYIESTKGNLEALNMLLERGGDEFRQKLKDALRVGIQRDTEVTSNPESTDANPKLVTQLYASAIGITYSVLGAETEDERKKLWEPLARIILEGAYEHTIIEGLRNNAEKMLSGKQAEPILLTQLGGGVFGNDPQWIQEAMASAIVKAGEYGIPFEVKLVHYGHIDPQYDNGFLEEAIANANAVMASSALASPAISLPTISDLNIRFLNQRGGKVEHYVDSGSTLTWNNYLLMFDSKKDAENKSQELAGLGIVGRGGNNKHVNQDKNGKSYIVLTDENVDRLRKIEANLKFLKQNLHQDSEFGIDTAKNDNYNLIFSAKEDAENKSQELAELGIFGSSGNKFAQKRILPDGRVEYFLTLTNNNIEKLKNILLQPGPNQRISSLGGDSDTNDFAFNFAPAPAPAPAYVPAMGAVRVVPIPPAPASAPYQQNLEFLQEIYQKKYGDRCIVNHEPDKDGQNNYTLLFKNLDVDSPETRSQNALQESRSLAGMGIFGSSGNKKRVNSNAQGPFIILTDENVKILRIKQSSLDAVRVDVTPAYGPAMGAVRVVPIPPAPVLMEPVAIAKNPIVEENIRLLTKNIKPLINNVTVEHEKKGGENQYRLVFQNADDNIKAYRELLRKYNIQPEAKEKEKDGEFVIVLNDDNVLQFKKVVSGIDNDVPAPVDFGGRSRHSVGVVSDKAGAIVSASLSYGDVRGSGLTPFPSAFGGVRDGARAGGGFRDARLGDAVVVSDRAGASVSADFQFGDVAGGSRAVSVSDQAIAPHHAVGASDQPVVTVSASLSYGDVGGGVGQVADAGGAIQPPIPSAEPSSGARASVGCFDCVRLAFSKIIGKSNR